MVKKVAKPRDFAIAKAVQRLRGAVAEVASLGASILEKK
jgi:hypothetical protein